MRDASCYRLMGKMEDGDTHPQNEVIHSLLFPEQFSLYQMEKEGNAFGVKKIRTPPCVHSL